MWEDVAIGVGNGIFIAATVPAFVRPPHFLAAVLTAAALAVFTVAYVALHMTVSAGSTAVEAAAWIGLSVRAIQIKRGTL